jgi:hypothetical protein
MTKLTMTNECTSVVGHFDGHGGAPGQYSRHSPMRRVQGYLGSPWTPPSGDYLLHIAPMATRATGKQATISKYTYFAGRFDGHGNVPVRNCAHLLMEKVQGFTRSHWTLPLGEYYVR